MAWFLITEAVSSWVKDCLEVAETFVNRFFYLRPTHVKYLNWSDAGKTFKQTNDIRHAHTYDTRLCLMGECCENCAHM